MTRSLFMLPALALLGCRGEDAKGLDEDSDGFTAGIDCDDSDASVYPGADEVCDDVDNNCDDLVDNDPADGTTYYVDGDGDGYGDAGHAALFCAAPGSGYADNGDDCDDGYALSSPGAAEICDGLDNDCDGTVDNDLEVSRTFYADSDGDGYGDPDAATEACEAPPGYTSDRSDCDDTDATLSPATAWLPDGDGDGYGDAGGDAYIGCEAPDRYTTVGGDCDDADAWAYPGAAEQCNGEDDDCDGTLPVDERDYDFDGELACDTDCDDTEATTGAASAEICGDGLDNNCDGVVDDACPVYLDSGVVDVFVTGESTSDYLGYSVSAGDINGDGDEDFIVGAYYADSDAATYSGRVYVFSGPMTSGMTIAAADADYTLSGTTTYDYFGQRSSGDMDLDGDGYSDIAVNAYGNDDRGSTSGATYVFYGPLTGDRYDEEADAIIRGINSSDYLGYFPFAVGDVDGDGDDDLSTNAYYWEFSASASSQGRIGIFDEPDGELTQADADIDIIGIGGNSYVGYAIDMTLDADGDGTADLSWGDYGEDKTFIAYGPHTGPSVSYTDAAVALVGSQSYGADGQTSGDFNGDGYDDIARASGYQTVGADTYAGVVYVLNGPFRSDRDVETAYDAKISGHEASLYLGRSNYGQMAAEDLSGDGLAELMIGAQYADSNGNTSSGATFVFFGPITGEYSAATPDLGYYGSGASHYTGRGVATGDLDSDGAPDLLLGSSGANSYVGQAYVLFDENF